MVKKQSANNLIFIALSLFLLNCTSQDNEAEKANQKINNCIDVKMNQGWDSSKAEKYCAENY